MNIIVKNDDNDDSNVTKITKLRSKIYLSSGLACSTSMSIDEIAKIMNDTEYALFLQLSEGCIINKSNIVIIEEIK